MRRFAAADNCLNLNCNSFFGGGHRFTAFVSFYGDTARRVIYCSLSRCFSVYVGSPPAGNVIIFTAV